MNMAAKKKTAQEAAQEAQEAAKEQEATQDTEQAAEGQEAQQEAQETAKEQEAERADKGLPDPCVYCGPSVRGVAKQYTTYMGGIPEPLQELIQAHPTARAMLVAPGKFAAFRKRLETTGTAEAVLYKKLKSEL